MVGLPYDCLANPLGAVRLTFEKALATGSDPSAFDGKDWGATELFRQFLFEDDGLSQVPFLNPSTITSVRPNTLVRFRGMIQDMLGNELYVGTYKDGETWRTNKFGDFFQFPMTTASSPDMRVWERRLLYCVPVPGQNSWIEHSSESLLNPSSISSSPQREKRHREDDTEMNDIDMQVTNEEVHASTSNKKMREDGITSNSSNSGDTPTADIGSATNVLPYFDRTSLPCLVKIYDSPESDLKLNDVFEFIGIFTFDPEYTVDKNDDNDFLNILGDDTQTQMPPSKVPRLHCLIHMKLSTEDFISGSPTLELKSHLVKAIREALLGHLTTILGNDGVAANFMLLHLLSKVHARVDSIAVGKLSLNLTSFNKETLSVYGHRLNLALKNLLPFTHCVPLTVDYLNKIPLAPKKDYQTNRLASGILQLAEGSHLTIDETQLQAGTLNSTGVENARVLKSLLELQKVEYDFTYYKMDMPADIQLLVLSEGKSNILPADLVLPFRPLSVDAAQDVEIEVLQTWRWYLATMRSLSHSIAQEIQKVVEDDLVAARQADRSLGSQDFSRLLTMGRLVSLSFGETSLTLEHWQMAKELERLRKERLQALVLIHRFFGVTLVAFYILWISSTRGSSPFNIKGLLSVSSTFKHELKVEVSHTNTPNSSSWSNHGWFYVSVRICLFLWVALLNLITISSTWARVIDVMDSESGSRLFGFIGAGATLGQLCGSLFATGMAWLGPYLLLVSAILMELAAQSSKGIKKDVLQLPEELAPIREADTDQAEETENIPELTQRTTSPKLPASVAKSQFWAILDGLKLILSSTYLLHVSLFLWLGAVVSSFFYFQKVTVIAAAVTDPTGRRRLFAQINSFIAIFILAGQLTLTGRILTFAGVTLAICSAPFVAFANLIALAVWPTWIAVAISETLRKVVTYVVTRPARELLFTVVSQDEKYKAKVCIDVIVQRLGDATAAAMYKLLFSTLNGKASAVSLYALPVCLMWILTAFYLGRRYRQLSADHSSQPAETCRRYGT